MGKKRNILVIGLGGTISMQERGGGGLVPSLSAHEILGQAKDENVFSGLIVEDFTRKPSANLTFEVLLDVVSRINTAGDDVAGVLVLQGTDSIEESAFVLDLLLRPDIPVAMTGAMRAGRPAISDGAANIQAALCYLGSPSAFGGRAVVVFADTVYEPLSVRKAASFGPSPFDAGRSGPLGHIIEGGFEVCRRPRELNFPVLSGEPGPLGQVWIITTGLGQGPQILSGLERQNLDGLVVEAFGGGHVSESWVAPLEKLAEEVPVVIASRTANGPTLSSTYGYPGGEIDLADRGLLLAGNLCALKARIVLSLLTKCRMDRAAVQKHFLNIARLP